ncbi:fimbrillin family protein [Prevotella copri]|uniref:fimbrillin family protein n=1 Tax=Segatella copri TaxID=165179 RepID=UPI001C39145E|nr:fimbrillin family protein [Segatella copri]MBV3428294.1 fimbrillin family protein [Segatella copri]
MKAIQFFAITALGAALFASCSNQEELATGSYPSDNLIRVTAGVNNDMTRGDEATATALTQNFSLTVVNNTNDKYSYANEIFSLSSGTEWTCTNKLLWQNLTTPVEIVALYPATDANTFSGVYSKENNTIGTITYGVNPDQSTDNDANDLLLYHSANFVPKNDLKEEKLDIQFNHAFCRVDIEVTIGTEFNATNGLAENPIQGIRVEGTKIAADINLASAPPTITAKGEAASIIPTPGNFTPAASASNQAVARYSCMVIPQTADLNIVLHTSDREYEWTGTEMALESGKQYTLQLNMTNKSTTARKFILRERK